MIVTINKEAHQFSALVPILIKMTEDHLMKVIDRYYASCFKEAQV